MLVPRNVLLQQVFDRLLNISTVFERLPFDYHKLASNLVNESCLRNYQLMTFIGAWCQSSDGAGNYYHV
jgi:hypothetical protein